MIQGMCKVLCRVDGERTHPSKDLKDGSEYMDI